MSLLEALHKEAGPERHRLMVAAGIAGVANALLLVNLNAIAHAPEAGDGGALYFYAVSLVAYVMNARYANHRTTELVESVIHRLKVRISEKIARIELDALERVKAAEICDRITENSAVISDRAGLIATMLQSVVILAFAMLYLVWLAPAAFSVVVLACAVGAIKFLDVRRDFVGHLRQTFEVRLTFLDGMTDLLTGFKELQFGRRRRQDVREHVLQASDALRAVSIQSNSMFADGKLVADAILFVVLAAVVYTLQQFVHLDASMMARIVAAVMFSWGPFMGLISGLMPYIRSNMALEEMMALEAKLEKVAREAVPVPNPPDPWNARIRTLKATNIEYEYAGAAESFRIGPMNLEMIAGEVVFIVGGNGSGKSTFVKVLTGLYAPTSGSLEADGIPVSRDNIVAFRDKVSAIFTDFHLFAKLYGFVDIDETAVRRLLLRMRLEGQTSFAGRAFTKLTLSTGQRKRIAMIVALLEDRPICMFDEWAADQDPEFRRYFYEELLPMLRRERKMVIVVSHDDRYFHLADRIVTMEYGKIRSIEQHRHASRAA
ncbi:MAG TPA: cyclic peptide export ABC transporter [Polyangium sp.]|nr:cyclic peptide export ABC transporter [Polyangium sp.]